MTLTDVWSLPFMFTNQFFSIRRSVAGSWKWSWQLRSSCDWGERRRRSRGGGGERRNRGRWMRGEGRRQRGSNALMKGYEVETSTHTPAVYMGAVFTLRSGVGSTASCCPRLWYDVFQGCGVLPQMLVVCQLLCKNIKFVSWSFAAGSSQVRRKASRETAEGKRGRGETEENLC